MSIPRFAVDRIDTWVFKVGIAIPLVCIAGLVLWHLFAFLTGKLVNKPKTRRQAPEPPTALQSLKRLPSDKLAFVDSPEISEATQLTAQIKNDPERLERACAALVESLAEMYLELAESWLRKGQPQQAAAALKKIVQSCPETRQAQLAQVRLRQQGAAENHS